MSFLRNPEIKHFIIAAAVITAVLSACALFVSVPCGLFVICASLSLSFVYLCLEYSKYKKLESICRELNRVLDGSRNFNAGQYSEGELSILANTVSKLTGALYGSLDAVSDEKTMLADSLADISHQLRTPLTSINLILARLNSGNLEESERKRLLSELMSLTKRIEWLTESLLRLSGIDAGSIKFHPRQITLKELIARSVEPVAIMAELHGLNIDTTAGEDTVCVDTQWTAEALGNILKNCIEHSPENSTITVVAAKNPVYAEITIRDNGSGISDEDINRLFDRFYKGENASPQSAGIGLALSKAIITRQNGTIKAENAPQGGALFTVRIYPSVE